MRRSNVFSLVFVAALFVISSACAKQTRTQLPNAHSAKVVKTRSGLVYEVVQQGTGATAQAGQTVLIHEVLTVDGRLIFSSREKNNPVKFLIGGKQVIPGVDEAVTGMKVGERRKATVPPALDGRTFEPAFIRPDADRHYDIELVQILN